MWVLLFSILFGQGAWLALAELAPPVPQLPGCESRVTCSPLHPSAVPKCEILRGNVLVVPTALSRGRSVLFSSNKIDKQITLEFPKLPWNFQNYTDSKKPRAPAFNLQKRLSVGITSLARWRWRQHSKEGLRNAMGWKPRAGASSCVCRSGTPRALEVLLFQYLHTHNQVRH